MANVVNYAENFMPFLLQMYTTESKSYRLTQSNPQVKWINAKTIKIPSLTLSGYKDHTRTPGFNTGSVENEWTPFALNFDRDIEFWVDPMDVDESNLTVSVANIQTVFEREQAIPESDCYRFSKLYSDFVKLNGEVDHTELTIKNCLDWFDTVMENMDDAGVPEEGRLLYLTPALHKIFKQAEGIQRFMNVQSNNGSVNRKVYDLDDVELIKVPKARMKSAYDFTDGFAPDDDAVQINAILIHPDSVVAREKYAYIKMFGPGTDSRTADGYLYQNRKYGDLLVLQKRLCGIAINAAGANS